MFSSHLFIVCACVHTYTAVMRMDVEAQLGEFSVSFMWVSRIKLWLVERD